MDTTRHPQPDRRAALDRLDRAATLAERLARAVRRMATESVAESRQEAFRPTTPSREGER